VKDIHVCQPERPSVGQRRAHVALDGDEAVGKKNGHQAALILDVLFALNFLTKIMFERSPMGLRSGVALE
jgi:hypothetical protein